MKNKRVIILRGASGSGKSTAATLFGEQSCICTADDFFYDAAGVYRFDPTKLGAAHEQCYAKFVDALHDPDIDTVVIANTNTKESEFMRYLNTATLWRATVFSFVVEKRHNGINAHGVPAEVIARQEGNIKNSLKLS